VDECKTWADKMEALASYARHAHDDTLLKLAMRIQARAMQRVGELLKEIKPARGQRNDLELGAGARPNLTRTQAATEAGLSGHQRKTALRVASMSISVNDRQNSSKRRHAYRGGKAARWRACRRTDIAPACARPLPDGALRIVARGEGLSDGLDAAECRFLTTVAGVTSAFAFVDPVWPVLVDDEDGYFPAYSCGMGGDLLIHQI
jgi:hypothetical protein